MREVISDRTRAEQARQKQQAKGQPNGNGNHGKQSQALKGDASTYSEIAPL